MKYYHNKISIIIIIVKIKYALIKKNRVTYRNYIKFCNKCFIKNISVGGLDGASIGGMC